MSLTLKYLSSELDRTERQKIFTESYQGRESEVDAHIASLVIGTSYTGRGALTSWKKKPDAGDIWNLTLGYSTDYDDGVESNPATNTGPTSQRLSTINIPMPLAKHANYLMNWNHYLIARGNQPIPAWWATSKRDLTVFSDMSIYRWIKSPDDMPPPQQGFYPWVVLVDPTIEAGQEEYDYETYVITETGKHTSKAKAGWAVATKINRIFDKPQLGDFGITALVGGDWKFDSAEVWFDGKYWVGQRTYTLSGDENGWNKQLYNMVTT